MTKPPPSELLTCAACGEQSPEPMEPLELPGGIGQVFKCTSASLCLKRAQKRKLGRWAE